jgi:type VI secretion system protein ImpF
VPRTEPERTVRQSLLDRLTDDDPRAPADPPETREESVRRYRASVLRDVEWLLNTRRPVAPAPPGLAELGRSAFAYGLPDPVGLAVGTPHGRDQLVRWVEETVTAFEPRLAGVRVALAEADQAQSPQVRFTLAALLRVEPSPERVLFDTVLDLASGGYAMRDGGAGATPGARAPR